MWSKQASEKKRGWTGETGVRLGSGAYTLGPSQSPAIVVNFFRQSVICYRVLATVSASVQPDFFQPIQIAVTNMLP